MTDPRLLLLSPGDSVYVLRDQIAAGEAVMVEGVSVAFEHPLGLGHKIARLPVVAGGKVIKYGAPIGRASRAIAPLCRLGSGRSRPIVRAMHQIADRVCYSAQHSVMPTALKIDPRSGVRCPGGRR